ncbi:hypothetical protein FISHEDRAFT_74325 [Fistulina hepatica ATCC 64428]|uniref:Uncharacterized protein n=1 Tax=Fistulina hepatica ATCC 64428 TaxID=1128425 RepID=A0A0D7ACZ3_9AGAR|nr:hypothetical protein FISHEDRAFT_74325 [Fistulina hepatica ATCC 64428]
MSSPASMFPPTLKSDMDLMRGLFGATNQTPDSFLAREDPDYNFDASFNDRNLYAPIRNPLNLGVDYAAPYNYLYETNTLHQGHDGMDIDDTHTAMSYSQPVNRTAGSTVPAFIPRHVEATPGNHVIEIKARPAIYDPLPAAAVSILRAAEASEVQFINPPAKTGMWNDRAAESGILSIYPFTKAELQELEFRGFRLEVDKKGVVRAVPIKPPEASGQDSVTSLVPPTTSVPIASPKRARRPPVADTMTTPPRRSLRLVAKASCAEVPSPMGAGVVPATRIPLESVSMATPKKRTRNLSSSKRVDKSSTATSAPLLEHEPPVMPKRLRVATELLVSLGQPVNRFTSIRTL